MKVHIVGVFGEGSKTMSGDNCAAVFLNCVQDNTRIIEDLFHGLGEISNILDREAYANNLTFHIDRRSFPESLIPRVVEFLHVTDNTVLDGNDEEYPRGYGR